MIKTNNILSKIGEEIAALHHAVVEIYKTHFPELDSLVPNPLDYLKLVTRIQNETVASKCINNPQDMNKVKMDDILPPSQIMVVTVTGSTSASTPLSLSALSQVLSLAEEAIALDSDRAHLLRFIESRMTRLAPNVTAIVGPHIAARVVAQAGCLSALAAMPACNVLLIGQQKQVEATRRNTGILYQSELVQDASESLRMKTAR